MVYTFLFASPAKTEPKQSAVGGKDNTGHQIIAGRDVYLGDGRIGDANKQPNASPEPSRLEHLLDSNVSIASLHDRLVSNNNHIFNFDQHGLPTLTALVENREADRGVGLARNLVAVIRFSRDDRQIASIQRAYWIGVLENNIDLDLAQSREVVVGQILEGVWFYYDNPRQQGLPARISRGRYRQMVANLQSNPIEPRPIATMGPHLDVAIRIVSLDTRETLATRSFRILPNAEGTDFTIWLFP